MSRRSPGASTISWTGCPDPSLVATVAATPQGGSAAPTVGTGGAIIVLAAAAVRDADRHRNRWSGRAAGHVDTVHLGSDGGRLTVVPDVFWRVRAVHASRPQRPVGQPAVPGDDELRSGDVCGRLALDHGPRPRSGHQLLRLGERSWLAQG